MPDRRLADEVRTTIESDGSTVTDLHLWRLLPGHLGAIVSVCPSEGHAADYCRAKFARYRALSHVTIQIDGSAGVTSLALRFANPKTQSTPLDSNAGQSRDLSSGPASYRF
jgi:hypothetical protein